MTRKASISPDDKGVIEEEVEVDSAKSSRAVLFEVDDGVRWPHFAVIIANLVSNLDGSDAFILWANISIPKQRLFPCFRFYLYLS